MPSNGAQEVFEIPATVYPGMFEGELQVSVKIEGEEINLMVSHDAVKLNAPLSDEGTEGFLLAEVVQKSADKVLLHLPGEVQGTSNRIRAAV